MDDHMGGLVICLAEGNTTLVKFPWNASTD